jgi:drug/metabolite transporter (DMT)-like permease
VQVLTAASASWVCYLLFESQPLELSFPYAAIVLYNALIPTVLAFWVWAKILERLPAPVAGQFVLLSPIAGILASAAVLGEAVTAPLIVSTAMILGGALMAYMQPRAETRSNGR